MTREEFKKLFLDPAYKDQIKEMQEGDQVVVYVQLDSIYNKAIEAYRPSLDHADLGYAMDYRAAVTKLGHDAFDKAHDADGNELLQRAKEKSQLVSFFINKKIPFEFEIEVIPSSVAVYGEPHHWNVYAKITVQQEYLYCYYGSKYKRKVFLFNEDGVVVLKYPPYNLQDTVMNIGVLPLGKTLEITEP